MINLASRVRALVFILACGFLAACSQTATSSYNGGLGKPLSDKQRAVLIEQARKRASAKRKARREAFLQRRRDRIEARKARREARRNRRAAGRKTVGRKTRASRKTVVKSRKGSIQRKAKRRVVRNSKKRVTRTRVASRRAVDRRKKVRRNVKLRAVKIAASASSARRAGIRLNAPWRCVPRRLKYVLTQITRKYGRVTINSTYRSKRRNRLVGGKRRSYHLRCQAVDFRVHGRTRGLTRWLARHPYVGGYNRYPSGYFHIDTGPKRTW